MSSQTVVFVTPKTQTSTLGGVVSNSDRPGRNVDKYRQFQF